MELGNYYLVGAIILANLELAVNQTILLQL